MPLFKILRGVLIGDTCREPGEVVTFATPGVAAPYVRSGAVAPHVASPVEQATANPRNAERATAPRQR